MKIFIIHYVTVSLLASLFYAIWFYPIFFNDTKNKDNVKKNSAWYIHLGLSYFLGSGFGWISLLLLINILKSRNFSSIAYPEILLGLISILGITGNLPSTVYGFVQSLTKVVDKITGK